MINEPLPQKLKRLLTGLTDQAIKDGNAFFYDGAPLRADEVADLALVSVICIAQDIAERVGMGSFNYRFTMEPTGARFPIQMHAAGAAREFNEIGPFILEVFEGEVMDCRADLARLFEGAVRLIRPEFSLAVHSNHNDLAVNAG